MIYWNDLLLDFLVIYFMLIAGAWFTARLMTYFQEMAQARKIRMELAQSTTILSSGVATPLARDGKVNGLVPRDKAKLDTTLPEDTVSPAQTPKSKSRGKSSSKSPSKQLAWQKRNPEKHAKNQAAYLARKKNETQRT